MIPLCPVDNDERGGYKRRDEGQTTEYQYNKLYTSLSASSELASFLELSPDDSARTALSWPAPSSFGWTLHSATRDDFSGPSGELPGARCVENHGGRILAYDDYGRAHPHRPRRNLH